MCRGLLWGLELEIREGEGIVPALLGAFAANERAQTNILENVRKQLLSWLRTSIWGVQEKCEFQAEEEGQSREGTRGRLQKTGSTEKVEEEWKDLWFSLTISPQL